MGAAPRKWNTLKILKTIRGAGPGSDDAVMSEAFEMELRNASLVALAPGWRAWLSLPPAGGQVVRLYSSAPRVGVLAG
jgi:hypothetical protein